MQIILLSMVVPISQTWSSLTLSQKTKIVTARLYTLFSLQPCLRPRVFTYRELLAASQPSCIRCNNGELFFLTDLPSSGALGPWHLPVLPPYRSNEPIGDFHDLFFKCKSLNSMQTSHLMRMMPVEKSNISLGKQHPSKDILPLTKHKLKYPQNDETSQQGLIILIRIYIWIGFNPCTSINKHYVSEELVIAISLSYYKVWDSIEKAISTAPSVPKKKKKRYLKCVYLIFIFIYYNEILLAIKTNLKLSRYF
ncbi:hypothetical protein AGLY_012095 [Aphis glycines]|uniref:Uncharacterized protein n=1 Tax=Aphis glycines TaxID=307491 RepID=A0A6G0TBA7_APHGL|nr:hypothetical protein AGLY_012095 [Aphis glycines]